MQANTLLQCAKQTSALALAAGIYFAEEIIN
jgi:hypothetical protein